MTHHSEASEPAESIAFRDSAERSGSGTAGGDSRTCGEHGPAAGAGDGARSAGWSRPLGPGPAPSGPPGPSVPLAATSGAPGSDGHRPTGPAGPLGLMESALAFSHLGRSGRHGHGGGSGVGDEAARVVPEAPRAAGAPAGAPADQVTLRSPAELADALPYLLGYRPEDSLVLVAVHDRHGYGSFGGRARLGIPARREDWPEVARQLARSLVSGCERRGTRPEGMVAFLCRDSGHGATGRQMMETLRPLAQLLRTECGSLDVPVLEALCLSDGRFWSYCCPGGQCCPAEGTPMGLPGSSVLSAALTYAGLQVRGTLAEFRARMVPWESAAALEQESALDAAGTGLVPRILDGTHRAEVAVETLDLGRRVLERLACAPPVQGALEADQRDDELITHQEAATLILGLQDRTTRDRAAEWTEDGEAGPALRLWRALARRCVGPYGEHAAAPLTLAGWVAWSAGDEVEAREALAMALGADPGYVFARLLHQACNEGLDPEPIRRSLRRERAGRATASAPPPGGLAGDPARPAAVGDVPADAADTVRTAPPAGDGGPVIGSVREAARRPGLERSRRSESRGPGRRRPRSSRARSARTGPSGLRPPGRRATGRG